MTDWISLPPEASSAGAARRFVSDALSGGGASPDILMRAEIVVSEMATNAIMHSRRDFIVAVDASTYPYRVEVSDPGEGVPERRDAEVDALSGRGLAIVEALASDWGVQTTDQGKTVWCILADSDLEPVSAAE
jgi:anti-sigma regulatory factor (Ser/Thr protein kinase)